MKPTELLLTTGLFDIKILIDSIKLEGNVKTRLSPYYSKKLIFLTRNFSECGNLNSSIIDNILTNAKDRTLKREDFDYAISLGYQSQERVVYGIIYFKEGVGIIGSTEKELYYMVGVTTNSKNYLPRLYEKTNIEGLLD